MRVLGNRVVVKPLEVTVTTKAGLYLGEDKDAQYRKGEVVAVGSGKITENGTELPTKTSVGQIVIFNKHAGFEFREHQTVYRVVPEDELVAQLEA